jgi:hypothetical protein
VFVFMPDAYLYDQVANAIPVCSYDKPNSGGGRENTRYGNVDKGDMDNGAKTSGKSEGPQGADAGGRKPE